MSFLFSTLNVYFTRVYLLWLLITATTICVVISLFEGAEFARRAMGKLHIGPSAILEMVLLKLPEHIQTLAPFIVLSAAMITLFRLNRHSEIIATRGFGVSAWQITFGLSTTTLFVGLFYLLALNPLGAALSNRLQNLENNLFSGQSNQLAISETGLWIRENAEDRQSIIRSAHLDANRQFQKITFQNFSSSGEFINRMDASQADLENGFWLLKNVVVYDHQNNRTSHAQLPLPTNLTIEKIRDSNTDPLTLSIWKLPEFISILNQAGLSSLSYRLYFHSQFARLGMMIAMIFLAAAFAMRPLRQGRGFMYVVIGILGGFIMHFLSDIVYAMGLADQIPVALAAWAPALVLFLISATVLVQVEEG